MARSLSSMAAEGRPSGGGDVNCGEVLVRCGKCKSFTR